MNTVFRKANASLLALLGLAALASAADPKPVAESPLLLAKDNSGSSSSMQSSTAPRNFT